jgi:hypothetical protein
VKGHVRKRSSSWYIVYNEPQEDDDRSVKQRWRGGFPTKREAEQALGLLQDGLNPRGRPPRADEQYCRIVGIYLAKLAERAQSNQIAPSINAEIAVEENMAESTVRGWLYGARQRGLLPRTTSTRSGTATSGTKSR